MKNAKNRIKLTEGQLHRVIKESVKKILKEDKQSVYNTPEYQLLLKAFPEDGFTDEELNLLKQLYNKSNNGLNDMGEAILATLDALNFHTEADELRNE